MSTKRRSLVSGVYLNITRDHDNAAQPIGRVYSENGYLIAEFYDTGVTRDQFLSAFGDVAARVLETEGKAGELLIRKARIFEFSVTDDEKRRGAHLRLGG